VCHGLSFLASSSEAVLALIDGPGSFSREKVVELVETGAARLCIKRKLRDCPVVCITADMWKTKHQWRAMGIRAAFHVGEGVTDTRVLRLLSFGYEREDAANAATDLSGTIADFGIDPFALTSDTASVMLKAGTLINETRMTAGLLPIKRVGCVDHVINLILKAMDKNQETQRFKSMLRKVGNAFTNPRVHLFLSRSGSQRTTIRSTTEIRWNCVKYTVEDVVALGDLLKVY
jgi:hypothetical protein